MNSSGYDQIIQTLAELSKTLDRYTQTRQAGLKPWIDQINH
ncbi:hypothetical protein SH580_08780 [Coraliomargarita algicola]|uniref:Uncharacterized protein n=1 Tax=Coraliomargarita algicola TaxID=3092156 RepID=A0ABZ0RSP4_9BACT|nr:hypothetical protein [Coraliomargarita sp. J2-16]WPJ97805.1 hypothetical protein SH580_08780 [Coraliomargarita sp. J2-16]